ncbi:MAG: hypothetical protein IPL61_24525 [Myxococcales bacterium]|nr:hypothetical protein [Myxococcales bacterium]
MRRALVLVLVPALLAACGADDSAGPVDAAMVDAALVDVADTDTSPPRFDAFGPDAAAAGFGALSGQCGVLTLAELDGTDPLWFQGEFTFDNRYDDPAERPQLTPGGQYMMSVPNAGGSSVFSEVFAYEWLARCEQATLLKTETEIVYDVVGKKVDMLVEIDGRKVGVSVTRAMTFPLGDPYTLAAATTLFERKLDDIQLATEQVSAGDRWSKQMLTVMAYDLQHAQVAMEAWSMLDAATKDDTLLVVAVTNGDDLFIYTDM